MMARGRGRVRERERREREKRKRERESLCPYPATPTYSYLFPQFTYCLAIIDNRDDSLYRGKLAVQAKQEEHYKE